MVSTWANAKYQGYNAYADQAFSNFIFIYQFLIYNTANGTNEGENIKISPVIKMQVFAFETGEVKLLPGPFKHAEEMGHKYLLALDPDRLLVSFYKAAGLKPKKPRYGGWESMELGGHSNNRHSGFNIIFAWTSYLSRDIY